MQIYEFSFIWQNNLIFFTTFALSLKFFVQKMKNRLIREDKVNELFPEVNSEGDVIGELTRGEAHNGTKRLHPVVHLHVFDNAGRLYLQQRADWKEIQPGKWDTAVGGHVDWGEKPDDALLREAYEELGLVSQTYEPHYELKYVYESEVERELVYIYSARVGEEIKLQPSETETKGGRFWSSDEIMDSIGKNVFTPMFEKEYEKYIRRL